MTRDEVRRLFSERQEAWTRRDANALAASHAEAGVVTSPMFARVSGRDAIQASYRALFDSFPDWTLTQGEPLVDGDRVAVPFEATATHLGEFMCLPGSGRRFDIQGVMLYTLSAGLIVDERRAYDFSGLLIKLGVLRAKPAR